MLWSGLILIGIILSLFFRSFLPVYHRESSWKREFHIVLVVKCFFENNLYLKAIHVYCRTIRKYNQKE